MSNSEIDKQVLDAQHPYWEDTFSRKPDMFGSEPGAINGGLLQKGPTGKHPIIVINVASVEDYTKKIESSGGKVVMPAIKIGDFGLYARVADTEGNVIGLWQTLKKC